MALSKSKMDLFADLIHVAECNRRAIIYKRDRHSMAVIEAAMEYAKYNCYVIPGLKKKRYGILQWYDVWEFNKKAYSIRINDMPPKLGCVPAVHISAYDAKKKKIIHWLIDENCIQQPKISVYTTPTSIYIKQEHRNTFVMATKIAWQETNKPIFYLDGPGIPLTKMLLRAGIPPSMLHSCNVDISVYDEMNAMGINAYVGDVYHYMSNSAKGDKYSAMWLDYNATFRNGPGQVCPQIELKAILARRLMCDTGVLFLTTSVRGMTREERRGMPAVIFRIMSKCSYRGSLTYPGQLPDGQVLPIFYGKNKNMAIMGWKFW